jgi:hypothetical protein
MAASAAPGPDGLLNRAIRDITNEGKTLPYESRGIFKKTANWGLAFLQKAFVDLRAKVCGKEKVPGLSGRGQMLHCRHWVFR